MKPCPGGFVGHRGRYSGYERSGQKRATAITPGADTHRLASLSPEGRTAAEKYITPLATSVAPLDGDLLVDASVHAHKKFEVFLQGAWRLEAQRPARAIELPSRPVSANSPQAFPVTEEPLETIRHTGSPPAELKHDVASPPMVPESR